jgi:hypothetical protein
MYTWGSLGTLLPLQVGIICLVAFVTYNIYVSSKPLIRRSLFSTATAIASYFGTIIHGMVVGSLLYYLPLYFEAVKGFSPVSAGIGLFPLTFTIAPMALITGLTMSRTGRYRLPIWVGWLMSTLGMGLFALLDYKTSTAAWVCISLVLGIGLGSLFSSQSCSAQASASQQDLVYAGMMYSFFQTFGRKSSVSHRAFVILVLWGDKCFKKSKTLDELTASSFLKHSSPPHHPPTPS